MNSKNQFFVESTFKFLSKALPQQESSSILLMKLSHNIYSSSAILADSLLHAYTVFLARDAATTRHHLVVDDDVVDDDEYQNKNRHFNMDDDSYI